MAPSNRDVVIFEYLGMKVAYRGGGSGAFKGPVAVLEGIMAFNIDLKNLPSGHWGALVRTCVKDCRELETLVAFKSYCDNLDTEQHMGFGALQDWETIQMALAIRLNPSPTPAA